MAKERPFISGALLYHNFAGGTLIFVVCHFGQVLEVCFVMLCSLCGWFDSFLYLAGCVSSKNIFRSVDAIGCVLLCCLTIVCVYFLLHYSILFQFE